MKVNNSERNRAIVVFGGIFLWLLIVIFSLMRIQVFEYRKNVERVQAQTNRVFDISPKRGTIFDRKGEILAISVKSKSAFLSNRDEAQSLALFRAIRRQIELSPAEAGQISRRISGGDKFIWIKRRMNETETLALESLRKNQDEKDVSKLDFIEEYRREYPHGATACHILGGVGLDEQGLSGVEYGMEKVIRGKGGKGRVLQDARRKAFQLDYIVDPVPGQDIYLTIDASIQFFIESELKKTVKELSAQSGTVVVLDARDGAVLAMASCPTFRPDNISRIPNREVLKNKAISDIYHPGSTFKVILASVALEHNRCSPMQEFFCHNGAYKIRSETIYDVHPYGTLTFEGILVHSSNIGAARIGDRVGRELLFQGMKTFGFGKPTGVDLPGEQKGILHDLKKWSGVSLAFLSHGYEIGVTPLQMARAYNVLASGGYLLQPFIIQKVEENFTSPAAKVRILNVATVKRMAAIMEEVVVSGTGKSAGIEGVKTAGKTGTTKIISAARERRYISSFGGFFPAENPRVTVFVVIEEPKGKYYGGDVAAPLFKSIGDRLVIYLKIFPGLDEKNEIRI